jgi:exopolysaccharide biosynthesis WecB/TagA/CpsF family protein
VVCEIDDFDLARFATAAASFGTQRYGYVVTPNADHLIRYCEDTSFRASYRSAEFVLLDSRVIALAMRFRGMRLPVCTGADLTAELLARVASPADRIVVIGGDASLTQELGAAYGLPNVHQLNPPMGLINDAAATERCLRFIEAHSPFRFCFLAIGSPQQEMIAQRLKARGKALGLVLCVGAALNFLTGAEKRAPIWIQSSALEWLHRLLHDPKRLARRYLIRGPRIFGHLLRGRLVLRARVRDTSTDSAGTMNGRHR